jgi:hypothetical protein
MMGIMFDKINAMNTPPGPRDPHDLSESEEEEGGNADPLDKLTDIVGSQDNNEDEEEGQAFDRALSDLAGFFHSEEERGEPLCEKLAKVLDASLRRKPQDASVKATAAKIKIPANVPNLNVPATNDDIAKAMSQSGKLLDTHLSRTNLLLSKAIVPIAQILNDLGNKKAQKVEYYMDGLNDSLRLIAASFNYLNQTRKEVARQNIREASLAQLCKWDCEVGQSQLFPFDVTKRCDELNKVKSLGSSSFKRAPRPGYSDFKWPKQRFESHRSQGPYPKGKKGPRPFLGKRQQGHKQMKK